MQDSRGFTVIEVAIASTLLLILLSVAAGQMPAVATSVERQMEMTDMQQRWRAAAEGIRRDVSAAGAGGANADVGLNTMLPAVWPRRLGLRGADAPGTVRGDVITVLAARPLPSVATVTAHPFPAGSGTLQVTPSPGCPPASTVCGLTPGTDIVIADGHGAFGLFTVIEVTPPTIGVRHNQGDEGRVYPAGSAVIPVSSRTYFLRGAAPGRPQQLVKYDGANGADVPVVDHVVGFHVDYFGEGEPPRMRQPLSEPRGPWTTYGARPPFADPSASLPEAGSNCLFTATGGLLAAPALPSLGVADGPLIPLDLAQLADGPWCPDGSAAAAYDADLWRIRSLVVTVRVEAALDALRGPAGLLFARPGTAAAGDRYAPDLEFRLRITPPNLSVRR